MKKNKIFIVMLLLTFIIFASSGINAQGEQLDLLSRSIKNYHLNNYEEALELNNQINLKELTTAAKIDTLYYRTLINLALGNITKGKEQLDELKEMGYDFGMIHYELARIYMNFYNNFDNAYYQTALEEFKKARALGVNSPQFHRDYAMAYMGVNNKERAVQQLEMAIVDNGTVNDLLNIANLHKELGNYDKAADFYNQVIEMDNKNVQAYGELGDVLIRQEKYAEASEALQKGVELNSDSLVINFQLGKAYYYTENYEQAKQYLTKVIELKQNYYKAHFYLGKTYHKQEDFQNAKYYLNEATKYNPNYADAYISLGDINLKQGNNYQAIANYSTAIEQNPEYPDGHFHLALAYIQSDMKEAAISELRKTIHLSGEHERAQELLDKLSGESN
ncbi:MAG TPA: tetratricopeptide repeat protein [Halanaerobiales bacterium]|nr:tetratricopeptide repeat protein [Halanaerobiales bacterium]